MRKDLQRNLEKYDNVFMVQQRKLILVNSSSGRIVLSMKQNISSKKNLWSKKQNYEEKFKNQRKKYRET